MKGKGLHKYAAWEKIICFSLIVEVNMISCFMSALQHDQDNVGYSALICYAEAFLDSVI